MSTPAHPPKTNERGIRNGLAPALVCGFFVCLIYVHYLAPDIVTGDSADLVGQSYLLGVCHQTGYPSTVMAGKLFTLLPIKNVPYRVSLLSAASGATAVLLTVLTIRLLLHSSAAAAFGGLLLGLSPVLWSRAESANVHAFAGMLTAAYILLFILWLVREKHVYLLAAVFLFGLSWTAHMQNLLHLPAVGFLLFVRRKTIPPKVLLQAMGLFMLGLSPYVWMMVRAAAAPPFDDYASPSTPARLIPYILGLTHKPATFSGTGTITRNIVYLGKVYAGSFLVIGIPLMIYGIHYFWKNYRSLCIFLVLVQGANTVYLANFSYYFSYFHYLIPSCIVSAVWISAGMKQLADRIGRRYPTGGRFLIPAAISTWVVAALLIFPSPAFLQWTKNSVGCSFPTIDWRNEHGGRRFLEEMKDTLPPNAVVVTPWTYFTLIEYAQAVEGYRPDLLALLHTERRDAVEHIMADPDAVKALNSMRPVLYVDAGGVVPIPTNQWRSTQK